MVYKHPFQLVLWLLLGNSHCTRIHRRTFSLTVRPQRGRQDSAQVFPTVHRENYINRTLDKTVVNELPAPGAMQPVDSL
jgi:hypothetical protein